MSRVFRTIIPLLARDCIRRSYHDSGSGWNRNPCA